MHNREHENSEEAGGSLLYIVEKKQMVFTPVRNLTVKIVAIKYRFNIFEPSYCALYTAPFVYRFNYLIQMEYTKSNRSVLHLTRTEYSNFTHCTWLSKVGPIPICFARVVKSFSSATSLATAKLSLYVYLPLHLYREDINLCCVCALNLLWDKKLVERNWSWNGR